MELNRVGGRPKSENKKEDYIKIRVTSDEKKAFNEKLKQSIYTSTSEMIRDVVLNGEYKTITLDQNLLDEKSVLITKCKHIGNNFNQLLKLLHQKKLTYFTKDDIQKMVLNIESISTFFKELEKSEL